MSIDGWNPKTGVTSEAFFIFPLLLSAILQHHLDTVTGLLLSTFRTATEIMKPDFLGELIGDPDARPAQNGRIAGAAMQ
jgi:hypothetical protein